MADKLEIARDIVLKMIEHNCFKIQNNNEQTVQEICKALKTVCKTVQETNQNKWD